MKIFTTTEKVLFVNWHCFVYYEKNKITVNQSLHNNSSREQNKKNLYTNKNINFSAYDQKKRVHLHRITTKHANVKYKYNIGHIM